MVWIQVGPWLASARKLASPDAGDCFIFEQPSSCPDFYEWNARVQITTWQPTPSNATVVPDGPIDYANKQWSGLVGDYYLERVRLIQKQALSDASAGQPLNHTAVDQIRASLAYNWTTSTKSYPVTPVGDAVQVSLQLFEKYAPYFASCQ
jgi:alpha-N-acetylglucosaminidase